MNNEQIKQLSMAELATRSKQAVKLGSEYYVLFWVVYLGGLVIYPALLVAAIFNKLPAIVADIFSVLWFAISLIALLVYTFYRELSNLYYNELAKRKL